MYKKDCYHCSHIRPRKGNLCSILLIKIKNIHEFCCTCFDIDIHILRTEENMLNTNEDDEGSKRFINFFTLKPSFA